MSMRRILATDFGIWPCMENVGSISSAMAESKHHWSQLANYLLLYDQVIIPTGNFQVLPVLRLMLGTEIVNELIRTNVIVLTRFSDWIGYGGNGAGTLIMGVKGPTDGSLNLATSHYETLEIAVETVIQAYLSNLSRAEKLEFETLLFDHVIESPSAQLLTESRDEAYKDILESPYLKQLFQLRNAGRSLNSLKGIGSNKITQFNPHSMNKDVVPEIEAIFNVTFDNFILALAGYVEASEITGDNSSLSLLKAKGQRFGHAIEGVDAFTKMQSISNVPDIGNAFENKIISPTDLLTLRESKECQALRLWFEKGLPNQESEETIRRFVEAIGKPSWIDNLQFKTFRTATTYDPSKNIAKFTPKCT